MGVKEPRLTILSQQQRALNLALALDKDEEKLADENGVCVIGAGVAGLTLAAALGTLGHRVTLLERAARPLHLQESNDTRWLHPNVYRWPEDGWDEDEADVPFLQWRAGMAGKVAQSIVRQWDAMLVEDNLSSLVHTHYGVGQVTTFRDGSFPAVNWTTHGFTHTDRFKSVVIAVGFGLEKHIEGIIGSHIGKTTPSISQSRPIQVMDNLRDIASPAVGTVV